MSKRRLLQDLLESNDDISTAKLQRKSPTHTGTGYSSNAEESMDGGGPSYMIGDKKGGEDIPLDTELVMESIHRHSSTHHGFVFLHQIYAMLANKTIVDSELSIIREKGNFKALNCVFQVKNRNSSSLKNFNSLAYIPTNTYLSYARLHLAEPILSNFCDFIRKSVKTSISRVELKDSEYRFSDSDINSLLSKGFLQYRSSVELTAIHPGMERRSESKSDSDMRDEEIYWISHPILSLVVQKLQLAEERIVSTIKKNRYKEISEERLKRMCVDDDKSDNTEVIRTVGQRKSQLKQIIALAFPFPYHLLDSEGRQIIFKVATHAKSDFIVRLR